MDVELFNISVFSSTCPRTWWVTHSTREQTLYPRGLRGATLLFMSMSTAWLVPQVSWGGCTGMRLVPQSWGMRILSLVWGYYGTGKGFPVYTLQEDATLEPVFQTGSSTWLMSLPAWPHGLQLSADTTPMFPCCLKATPMLLHLMLTHSSQLTTHASPLHVPF